ncbi:20541_t:CDS:2, partial [Gigaspora margarita]
LYDEHVVAVIYIEDRCLDVISDRAFLCTMSCAYEIPGIKLRSYRLDGLARKHTL